MRCAPAAATAHAVLLAVSALRVQRRAGARQSPPWKGRMGRPQTERPMKPTLILFLTLLVGPALAGSHQAPLDVQARVVDALADDMRAAEESDGVPAHLEFRMVDLNGDGRPEVIVQLLHPFHCGSRGCAMFVFDLTSQRPRSLADIIASEVKPARTTSNGWRDILVDGRRWTFRQGRYRAGR